jgi:hypothetical protein
MRVKALGVPKTISSSAKVQRVAKPSGFRAKSGCWRSVAGAITTPKFVTITRQSEMLAQRAY